MTNYFDRSMSFVLAAATVVCATVLVRRDMHSVSVPAPLAGPPQFIRDWRSIEPYEIRFGNHDGPIQLVEFTDFECPFCRRFHESVLPRLLEAFPDSVGWGLVHFPLSMHRFAARAARAVECAAAGDAPSLAFLDVLFAKQDSLGLKSWGSYAFEGGVRDTVSFVSCLLGSNTFVRIDSGRALAQRFGIRGTPGVMVNGWLFATPPSDTVLVRTAKLLLANGNVLPDIKSPKRP